jgi:NCS1 family nucleobase:cation symporter-1
MVSMGALWQLAYAPYVSDYSRYLPPDSGPRQAFWSCYWGTTLGAVLPMILGALIGPAVIDGDVVAALSRLTGKASTAIVLLFVPGVAVAGAICFYGGSLAIITLAQTFAAGWRATSRARTFITIGIFLAALLIGLEGASNFLTLYSQFNELLLYLLIPWTAVNLVDYYLVRFGNYDVPSFFARDGGIYGRYNVAALVCYGLGILVQIPFIASDLYTGPIARALGGIDLSWIVGGQLHRRDRLGQRSNLIELDEHCIRDALRDAARYPGDIGDEEVVADQFDFAAELPIENLPSRPVVLG